MQKFILGDCVEELKKFPNEHFDLMIDVDPEMLGVYKERVGGGLKLRRTEWEMFNFSSRPVIGPQYISSTPSVKGLLRTLPQIKFLQLYTVPVNYTNPRQDIDAWCVSYVSIHPFFVVWGRFQ